MDGCAQKPDCIASVVYFMKKCSCKIERTYKKSPAEKRAKKSVSSLSYGRNSLFLPFMSRRRMAPLDFTSSENFVFGMKIELLTRVCGASSQKLEASVEKPIDDESKTSTCRRN
jgi:hypothetical protein